MTIMHYNKEWLMEEYENNEKIDFIFFWGHTNIYKENIGKFIFSQWYESPFTIGEIAYKTTEHWMMAQKALLFEDIVSYEKILTAATPAEAKELGRRILNYNDVIWDTYKFDIVKTGNIHKFNQYPEFAKFLCTTQNKVIVEACPVDAIWGIGLPQNSPSINDVNSWRGQNLLGFALMEVRDFMNSVGHFDYLKNAMLPPWIKYKHISANDSFWQMGAGEDYLTNFHLFFEELSHKEKTIYALCYPAYNSWKDFYN